MYLCVIVHRSHGRHRRRGQCRRRSGGARSTFNTLNFTHSISSQHTTFNLRVLLVHGGRCQRPCPPRADIRDAVSHHPVMGDSQRGSGWPPAGTGIEFPRGASPPSGWPRSGVPINRWPPPSLRRSRTTKAPIENIETILRHQTHNRWKPPTETLVVRRLRRRGRSGRRGWGSSGGRERKDHQNNETISGPRPSAGVPQGRALRRLMLLAGQKSPARHS